MSMVCDDFQGVTLYSGAGHWVQQERAPEVNRTLVDFVNSVSRKT